MARHPEVTKAADEIMGFIDPNDLLLWEEKAPKGFDIRDGVAEIIEEMLFKLGYKKWK